MKDAIDTLSLYEQLRGVDVKTIRDLGGLPLDLEPTELEAEARDALIDPIIIEAAEADAIELDATPVLSEVAQRIKNQIESAKHFSHVKDIAMQLSLSNARELITDGEFEELFALLQNKRSQLQGSELSEPVDPYAPTAPWSPSGTLSALPTEPYVDIEMLRANDGPEVD